MLKKKVNLGNHFIQHVCDVTGDSEWCRNEKLLIFLWHQDNQVNLLIDIIVFELVIENSGLKMLPSPQSHEGRCEAIEST